ncbi:hypothetical protein BJ508DRAFT_321595 [Ascobolus immersus RN42]|uniref:Uncharacterized protein n=1 Tax=Ascobolus immersus RN42 TaxID=1160509 RepID=A0A3N4IQG2_ASCIM|nr:hypothetical protein BJ508DRAFT_321595 [Ascobolus immersus RN42]
MLFLSVLAQKKSDIAGPVIFRDAKDVRSILDQTADCARSCYSGLIIGYANTVASRPGRCPAVSGIRGEVTDWKCVCNGWTFNAEGPLQGNKKLDEKFDSCGSSLSEDLCSQFDGEEPLGTYDGFQEYFGLVVKGIETFCDELFPRNKLPQETDTATSNSSTKTTSKPSSTAPSTGSSSDVAAEPSSETAPTVTVTTTESESASSSTGKPNISTITSTLKPKPTSTEAGPDEPTSQIVPFTSIVIMTERVPADPSRTFPPSETTVSSPVEATNLSEPAPQKEPTATLAKSGTHALGYGSPTLVGVIFTVYWVCAVLLI